MFSSNTSQVSSDATYVEDVFSTTLYQGNGSTQTINNGIDESGKGALTWIKQRSTAGGHQLYDTARGATQLLSSSNANAQSTFAAGLTSFNANGFSLGSGINCNTSGETYASWTFRKQPKFFDVVTFTGNGAVDQFVTHNLQSSYGFIVVKRTDSTSDWWVLAKDSSGNVYWSLKLNSTAANMGLFSADPNTSTGFYPSSVLGGSAAVNGGTYVAYLFAHNAGGFGLTGTDNVISCGSFTTNGSGVASTTLGYEPQWLLMKSSSANDTYGWFMIDNMRGWATGENEAQLYANSSAAEGLGKISDLSATGFSVLNLAASTTYIYIAIRRGPMKTPTTGTSVFSPVAVNNATSTSNTIGFPLDLQIAKVKDTVSNICVADRLRGISTTDVLVNNPLLITSSTGAELSDDITRGVGNTAFLTSVPFNSTNAVYWNFRRAPGFFDEVCYTGTGSARTVSHNLGVAPELMIVKSRTSASYDWAVYSATTGNNSVLFLNTTAGPSGSAPAYWNSTTPTASVFSLGNGVTVNESGANYVAYLFASCPGVSKVGSYTGTGSSQTINCGFTGGARFVLIKRATASTSGNWRVYDTARGMVSGTDNFLYLNSTAAEGNANSIYTASTGFEVVGTSNDVNANGNTYIYLAIA